MPLGALCVVNYHHIPNMNALCLANLGAKVIESQRQSDMLLAEQKGQLAQLNKILSAISESILVWNEESVLIHINESAQELTNLSAQHALGHIYSEFIEFPPFIKEAIEHRQPITDVEASLKVGEKAIDSIMSLRFIIQNDRVQYVILILRAEKAVRKLVMSQYGAFSLATLDSFIGESPRMHEIRRQVRICADADGSVLIRGEGGTGKTILAGAIHNEGRRKDNPFITFPCSAYSNEMVAVELFGYEEEGDRLFERAGQPSKFELARGGTVFIQDVDLLPLEAQAALLNVLELEIVQRVGSSRPVPVDTRIIVSTSANMEKLIARGIFRSDLYYRINVFEIKLPPLREQPEDIPLLVDRILSRLEKQFGHTLQMAPGMMDVLKRYNWPGNIQELEIVLERAAAFAGEGGFIGPMHLPEFMFYPSETVLGLPLSQSDVQPLDEMEMELILRTAQMCKGNQTKMAQILGISRTTLWRKLKMHRLSPQDLKRS
jgi:transcriptional activator for dhaKLM operon